MIKTNGKSWVVTLLLAAIVPFASGCHECEKARRMRSESNEVLATINAAINNRTFTNDMCGSLLATVSTLQGQAQETVNDLCPNDSECSNADRLKSGILQLQINLGDACRNANNGAQLGPAETASDTLLLPQLRRARGNLYGPIIAGGTPLLRKACGDNEPTGFPSALTQAAPMENDPRVTARTQPTPVVVTPAPVVAPLPGPVTPGSAGVATP
jgi:hypothetical protein